MTSNKCASSTDVKKPSFLFQYFPQVPANRIPPLFCYDRRQTRAFFSWTLPKSEGEGEDGDDAESIRTKWTVVGKLFGSVRTGSILPELTLVVSDSSSSNNNKASTSTDDQKPIDYSCGLSSTHADNVEQKRLDKARLGLLKSHLQKCVRRGKVDVAVKTAALWLQLDCLSLLRRLPIIMIEDAQLTMELPLIVWLMCAYSLPGKKEQHWKLSAAERRMLLNVVRGLCLCPQVDRVGVDEALRISDAQIAASLQHDWQRSLLWALKIRAGVGGMHCDVHMLFAAMSVFYQRWTQQDESKDGQAQQQPIVIETQHHNDDHVLTGSSSNINEYLEPLREEDWELAAVDFHCSNLVDRLPLLSSDKDKSAATWRAVLWNCSSCLTNKEPMAGEADETEQRRKEFRQEWQPVYDKHSKQIEAAQREILKRVFYGGEKDAC